MGIGSDTHASRSAERPERCTNLSVGGARAQLHAVGRAAAAPAHAHGREALRVPRVQQALHALRPPGQARAHPYQEPDHGESRRFVFSALRPMTSIYLHSPSSLQEVATSTQMYSDSGDDSCDEKMMLTIETIQTEGDAEEKQLVVVRPGGKMDPDHS